MARPQPPSANQLVKTADSCCKIATHNCSKYKPLQAEGRRAQTPAEHHRLPPPAATASATPADTATTATTAQGAAERGLTPPPSLLDTTWETDGTNPPCKTHTHNQHRQTQAPTMHTGFATKWCADSSCSGADWGIKAESDKTRREPSAAACR